MPGPEVDVIARAPAQPAPRTIPIAASSSSACTTANVALPSAVTRNFFSRSVVASTSEEVLGSTATLVMTEGDTTQVYVQGKVDEADIAHVYMGQQARIKVESFRDRMFYGKVTKISPMGVEADNVTTFEVRVSINNPGGELKANMTANAEILLSWTSTRGC